MTRFYTSIRKFCLLAAMGLLCAPMSAQVDYKALPDYDNVPPVDWRLGVKNGNAPQQGVSGKEKGVRSAKSHAFSAEAEDDELPDHLEQCSVQAFPALLLPERPFVHVLQLHGLHLHP